MPAYGEAQQQTPTAKHPTTEHPVGQEEVKTAVTASLHAFGINTQARECAKNARKRPSKARRVSSQWLGGLLVLLGVKSPKTEKTDGLRSA